MSASDQPIVHTPGPWRVISTTGLPRDLTNVTVISSGGDGGVYVAEVYDAVTHSTDLIGSAESDGNARLIAAAPELLEALRELNDATNPLVDVDAMDLHRARVKAQNAIKVATEVV